MLERLAAEGCEFYRIFFPIRPFVDELSKKYPGISFVKVRRQSWYSRAGAATAACVARGDFEGQSRKAAAGRAQSLAKRGLTKNTNE